MPAITADELRDKLTVIIDNGAGDLPVVFYFCETEEAGPMLSANKPKVIKRLPYVKSQLKLKDLTDSKEAVLIPVDG